MRKVISFLKETRAELAKVVWPTRRRTFRLTIIVIIVTIIFGAFIAGVDHGLNKGLQYVIDTTTKKDKGKPDPNTQTVPVGDGQNGTLQIPAQPQQGQPAQPNQPAQ